MIQRVRMLYNFKGVVNVTILTDVIRNDNYVFESIISVLMSSTPLNLTKLNSAKFGILVEPLECLDVFPCPAKFFFPNSSNANWEWRPSGSCFRYSVPKARSIVC